MLICYTQTGAHLIRLKQYFPTNPFLHLGHYHSNYTTAVFMQEAIEGYHERHCVIRIKRKLD